MRTRHSPASGIPLERGEHAPTDGPPYARPEMHGRRGSSMPLVRRLISRNRKQSANCTELLNSSSAISRAGDSRNRGRSRATLGCHLNPHRAARPTYQPLPHAARQEQACRGPSCRPRRQCACRSCRWSRALGPAPAPWACPGACRPRSRQRPGCSVTAKGKGIGGAGMYLALVPQSHAHSLHRSKEIRCY